MLAYGVVFVLLIGEIDLSIGYVSGIAGVVVAQADQLPDRARGLPGWSRSCSRSRRATADRRVPGLVRRLHRRAVVRRHARRPPDLAGRDPELDRAQGVIVIQDNTINNVANYFFSDMGGWIIARSSSAPSTSRASLGAASRGRRHGVADPRPVRCSSRSSSPSRRSRFVTVASATRTAASRSSLLLVVAMLLVLTFLAKRTTFGRHVYAVGGNAEAARRAGHQRRRGSGSSSS